jgi:Domain of unknown function (DUF4864)
LSLRTWLVAAHTKPFSAEIRSYEQEEFFMRKIIAILSLWFCMVCPATAGDLSPQDKQTVQGVITDQLKAFAAEDGDKAFSFAAPLIRNAFSDANTFMQMVKRGYEPVYRNKNYVFGESFTDQLGRPAQKVTLTAVDGRRYEAIYTLEQQNDGSWKISGCYLVPIPETGA